MWLWNHEPIRWEESFSKIRNLNERQRRKNPLPGTKIEYMGWAKDKIAENILPSPLHLNLFWLIIIFCYEFSYIEMYNTFTRK